MANLIILEGADKTGKSTLCKKLTKELGYDFLRQPNDTGPLAFLGDALQNYGLKEIDSFARQSLHALQNVYDLSTVLQGQDLVMDRSGLSTLAYSRVMDISKGNISLLTSIYNEVQLDIVKRYNYAVRIFILTADKPLDALSTSTPYEQLAWNLVNDAYKALYDYFTTSNSFFFHPKERIVKFNVDKPIDETWEWLKNMVPPARHWPTKKSNGK